VRIILIIGNIIFESKGKISVKVRKKNVVWGKDEFFGDGF